MRRWFTADFHLGMKDILKLEHRPFASIDDMDRALLEECCTRAEVAVETLPNGQKCIVDKDIIIHAGDLATFGEDGLAASPQRLVAQIPATFINLRGNHDINNKVKSLAVSMRTKIGPHKHVSISHYPSYDSKAKGHFLPGDIHLCGHVHSAWKHCLDTKRRVLNINIGVDVWDYKLVPED